MSGIADCVRCVRGKRVRRGKEEGKEREGRGEGEGRKRVRRGEEEGREREGRGKGEGRKRGGREERMCYAIKTCGFAACTHTVYTTNACTHTCTRTLLLAVSPPRPGFSLAATSYRNEMSLRENINLFEAILYPEHCTPPSPPQPFFSPSSTTDAWGVISKVFESGSLVGVVPHVGRRLRRNRVVLEGEGGGGREERRGGGGGGGKREGEEEGREKGRRREGGARG